MKQTPEELYKRNQGLVRWVANWYTRHLPDPQDYDGLVSEVMMALWEASSTYDDQRGTAFSTYATPKMRWAASHFVLDQRRHGMRMRPKGRRTWKIGKPIDEMEFVAKQEDHEPTVWNDRIYAKLATVLSDADVRFLREWMAAGGNACEAGRRLGIAEYNAKTITARIGRVIRKNFTREQLE
jgi:RNA polymerase sigma factor (sigma-70 family)